MCRSAWSCARTTTNCSRGRQGPNNVINPVRFTGLLLAGSAQGSHVADYMADLASVRRAGATGRAPVRPSEVGKSLDALDGGGRGLRIYRGEQTIGFWENGGALQAGDVVVEIRPTADTDA